ncbi:MAG: hypothetical protein ACREA9_26405 [Pyrinomonadaceae bacterium]
MSVKLALLGTLPPGLAEPLLSEYCQIAQNYMEHRWSAAELSGGRFCEIVFTILDGHAKSSYAASPSKPANFVSACRSLESNAHVPRSFQILVPRLLPALYEIRNNRGVGHVGGDVDPNHMDATAVISLASWVMAELVRVFHGLKIAEAQRVVDSIAERRTPLIWSDGDVRRILDTSLPLKQQILLLAATSASSVEVTQLLRWTEYKDAGYFMRLLRKLHRDRMLELSQDETVVQVLPPGSKQMEMLLAKQQVAKQGVSADRRRAARSAGG